MRPLINLFSLSVLLPHFRARDARKQERITTSFLVPRDSFFYSSSNLLFIHMQIFANLKAMILFALSEMGQQIIQPDGIVQLVCQKVERGPFPCMEIFLFHFNIYEYNLAHILVSLYSFV